MPSAMLYLKHISSEGKTSHAQELRENRTYRAGVRFNTAVCMDILSPESSAKPLLCPRDDRAGPYKAELHP